MTTGTSPQVSAGAIATSEQLGKPYYYHYRNRKDYGTTTDRSYYLNKYQQSGHFILMLDLKISEKGQDYYSDATGLHSDREYFCPHG